MKKKTTASVLVCAVMLLTVVPLRIFSQTLNQTTVEQTEQKSVDSQSKKKTDNVNKFFAEEMARNQAGILPESTVKRIEKKSLQPQIASTGNSGMSKKQKVLLVVIVVLIVGLAIVVANNAEPSVRCEDDPSFPDCIP